MFGGFRAIVERCNAVLGYISGLGILIMGLILSYEVVCRYFFNSPTIWVQEVAVYIYMWTMLAGCSYTLQKGKHVRIDLVLEKLSKRTQKMLEVVTSIVGMGFSAVVAWQGYLMLASSLKFSKVSATPLRVPMWIPQSALFLGFALLTLQFLIIAVVRFNESVLTPKGGVAE
jgi:TRAP-type C4-dicarboxylate transport system permease small subunit